MSLTFIGASPLSGVFTLLGLVPSPIAFDAFLSVKLSTIREGLTVTFVLLLVFVLLNLYAYATYCGIRKEGRKRKDGV
jgi:heme/copper-type cytochrome/quinol oxidase subunit 3